MKNEFRLIENFHHFWEEFLKFPQVIPFKNKIAFHCGGSVWGDFDDMIHQNRFTYCFLEYGFELVWVDKFFHPEVLKCKKFTENKSIHLVHAELDTEKDCISPILEDLNFSNNVGMMCIDLDSIDYYVMNNFNGFADILMVEYNPTMRPFYSLAPTWFCDGQERSIVYKTKSRHTGASFHAICYALRNKNLSLIGALGDSDLVFMNKDFDSLFDFHFFDIDDEDSINKTFETLNSINPQIYYYTDKVDEWSIDVRGL
jgi:hypothetical protein